jgi:hypothetical protein
MTADKKSKASTKSKKKGGYDYDEDLVPPPGYENRPQPPRLADIGRIGNVQRIRPNNAAQVEELQRRFAERLIAAAPPNNNNTNHIIPAPRRQTGPTGTPVQSPRQSPRARQQNGGKAKTKAKNNKKK